MLGDKINPIQEAIEQKKKENKGFALGVLNELLDEKDAEIKRLEYTLRIIEDAKSEIERLEKDNKKLTINMNAFGLTAIRQKEEKDALAREIFEEIEKALDNSVETEHFKGTWFNLHKCMLRIAELKKKYTESEGN